MLSLKKFIALVIGSVSLLSIIPFVAKAVRTDVSRDFPVYDNGGQPDLTLDPKRFVSQMEIIDRLFDASSCELIEGSVGGTGYRRLLRFDVVLINGGDGDLVVGSRPIRRIRIVPYSSIHRATIITTSMVFPIISCSTWMAPSRRKDTSKRSVWKTCSSTRMTTRAAVTLALSRALRPAGRIGISNNLAANGSTSPGCRKAITLYTWRSMQRTLSMKARTATRT